VPPCNEQTPDDATTISPNNANQQIEGKHVLKPQGTPSTSPSSDPTSANASSSRKKRIAQKPPEEKDAKENLPFLHMLHMVTRLPAPPRTQLFLTAMGIPKAEGPSFGRLALTFHHRKGVTITQAWTTASLLDSKVELADVVAPGAKVDIQNLWNPSKPAAAAQKINLAYKHANVHSRAFVNYGTSSGKIDTVLDVTAGHDGFLVGAEAAYDVQTAKLTKYSLGLGYQAPTYSASLIGTQNLQIIAASYYQKVNSSVEVGAKAGYDVANKKASGLELASKYKLDPLSFAKVCFACLFFPFCQCFQFHPRKDRSVKSQIFQRGKSFSQFSFSI
jgi:voltage-dependent anion channel protein 2